MSLTSANSIITLQSTLFQTPIQLQNFAADDITGIDAATILEHQMGVDGVLSFGFVWAPRMQEISLKADGPNNTTNPGIAFFDAISTQQEAAQDVYQLSGTIILPSIGKMFNLVNGGLESYPVLPAVRKTLQPQRFRIVWNRVVPINTR